MNTIVLYVNWRNLFSSNDVTGDNLRSDQLWNFVNNVPTTVKLQLDLTYEFMVPYSLWYSYIWTENIIENMSFDQHHALNHIESKHFPNSFTYTCSLCPKTLRLVHQTLSSSYIAAVKLAVKWKRIRRFLFTKGLLDPDPHRPCVSGAKRQNY